MASAEDTAIEEDCTELYHAHGQYKKEIERKINLPKPSALPFIFQVCIPLGSRETWRYLALRLLVFVALGTGTRCLVV